MHMTRNDIPEKKRHQITNILNQHLASAIDLSFQAKQAHWNVKAENFTELHEVFDTIYETISASVDEIGERISQLGGQAEGTIQVATKKTYLKPLTLGFNKGPDLVSALADAVAVYGKCLRKSIEEMGPLKDAVSGDMLTQIARSVDKQLWILESHLNAN
ncbi:MAG: DNA starvation/stationary phase protection protein Dps [Bdellovibrionales bacterium]|nr:DNA starvation/stationary phase protection protein Dps [Bdellovibrionales bacterium]